MSSEAKYQGPRSQRFRTFTSATNKIGPGSYDLSNVPLILNKDTLAAKTLLKPTSKLGVGVVKSIRFPNYTSDIPGAGQYETKTFLDLIDSRCTSTRETFNTLERKNDMRWKKRDAENAEQMLNLKDLIGKHDIFTDKKACRRMAYLSLYYPLKG
ncbi:hypothetical protein HDV01_005229 [Terramyces sp. JEL0728]|nr:hypothetical protein HDV01_005229 [Terramyces sp. JEL0728]